MKIKKSIRLFTVLSVLSPMALSMMSPSALAQVADTEVKVGTEVEKTVTEQEETKAGQPPFLLTETETISNDSQNVDETTDETTDEVITDADSDETTDEVITDADSDETTDEVITDADSDETTDEVITDGDSDETTDETTDEVITDDETDRDLAGDGDALNAQALIDELTSKAEALNIEREEIIKTHIEAKTSLEELTAIVEEFNAKLVLEESEAEAALELTADELSVIATLKSDIAALKLDAQADIIAQIEVEDDEDVIVDADEVDEEEEDVVVDADGEEDVDNTLVDNSVSEENDQLHQVVCQQRNQISELTAQVEALRADATPYESMMNMMSQLMMMNQMMMMQSMQQPQQTYGYGGNAVDFTGQMMAPMMMMQSMMMGMQVSNLSASANPYGMANQMMMMQAMQPQNQNVYNVGGDYYGRDYSMTMPGASSLMSGSTPNIPFRDYNFGNIVSGERVTTEQKSEQKPTTDVVRTPSQADTTADAEAEKKKEKVDTSEMVGS